MEDIFAENYEKLQQLRCCLNVENNGYNRNYGKVEHVHVNYAVGNWFNVFPMLLNVLNVLNLFKYFFSAKSSLNWDSCYWPADFSNFEDLKCFIVFGCNSR